MAHSMIELQDQPYYYENYKGYIIVFNYYVYGDVYLVENDKGKVIKQNIDTLTLAKKFIDQITKPYSPTGSQ